MSVSQPSGSTASTASASGLSGWLVRPTRFEPPSARTASTVSRLRPEWLIARYASASPGGPDTSEALAASAGRPAARRVAANPVAACALAPMPSTSSRPVPSIVGTGDPASAARTVDIERARISGCARTTARKSSLTL